MAQNGVTGDESQAVIRVLFVCLGNICRSPMAEAVFKHVVAQHKLTSRFKIDSCGTAGYHIGDDPDPRTVSVCQKHRVPISHRARQLSARDFAEFDYILGMDSSNISNINRVRPAGSAAKVALFGSFDPRGGDIIEDPYYGDVSDFEQVYQQCLRSSEGFLKKLNLV